MREDHQRTFFREDRDGRAARVRLPEETLELGADAVDIVCIGEYDHTVRDVLANLNRPGSVPGIAHRDGKKIRRTGNRPLIEDLDSLRSPHGNTWI